MRLRLFLTFLLLSFMVQTGHAYTLHAVGDANVKNKKNKYKNNYGDVTGVEIGDHKDYGFARFDFSEISKHFGPENILRATLRLYVKTLGHGGDFKLTHIYKYWDEDTINVTNMPYRMGPDINISLDAKIDQKYLPRVDTDTHVVLKSNQFGYVREDFIFIDVTEHFKESMIPFEDGGDNYDKDFYSIGFVKLSKKLEVEFASKEDGPNAMLIELLIGAKKSIDGKSGRANIDPGSKEKHQPSPVANKGEL